MAPDHELSCVTGRFQPPHRDHLELMLVARAAARRLVVAITNPDPNSRRPDERSEHRHLSSANPFTYHERLRMVTAALTEAGVPTGDFDVVPFPLHDPAVWAHYVPLDALHFVRAYSDWERAKARSLEAHGYSVHCLEGHPARRRSGTVLRAAMMAGEAGRWQPEVPVSVGTLLDAFLARVPLAQRG